jgi:histidinol-phosphate/aromatic aminotransferase/cobyric acid decarboxylase-like protein
VDLDEARGRHGGYWRQPLVDFHYLVNQYFPPSELVAELQAMVPRLIGGYPSTQRVLAELLSTWKNDEGFTADNLVVGNGSSELIKMLNDRVLTKTTVPLPTFNEFGLRRDADVHRYPLREEDGFRLDVERLLYEIDRSGSECAAITNPANPVGNLVELHDIREILKRGILLVVDEAFIDFTDPQHSAESLVPVHDNLIVVKSATKSMGIAGLRVGYVLTTNSDVKRALRAAIPIWNVNSLAEYFIEAYPRFSSAHRDSLDRIRRDVRWFFESLRSVPIVEPFPTHANAVFCGVRGSARRLARLLFDRHRFFVKDGIRQFELETAGSYVRLALRNRDDNARLIEALQAISREDIHEPRPAA